jgi:hypothetical protein
MRAVISGLVAQRGAKNKHYVGIQTPPLTGTIINVYMMRV